jgi:hypothetical protein
MKTLSRLCLCCSLLVLAGLQEGPASRNDKEPKHLRAALDLVEHLSMKETTYNHGKPDVQFTAPCRSHADCSGFLDALLQHSYGCTPKQFEDWFGRERPTADQYHDAITKQKAFSQIADFRQVVPGDVLAVKYAHPKEKSTGHVMLVAGAPKRIEATDPVRPKTEQWAVTIIDSARSGHGKTDTRHGLGEGGKDHDGLGKGELRIYTDGDGKIVGYTWSVNGKEFVGPPEDDTVAGRFKI